MKLISWNIQWGRGVDGRVDLDRIVADARRLADFDLLCLQEVSAGHDRLPGCDGSDQFAQLAALLPGYQAIAGVATDLPGPAGQRRRFGNMIFSRLPVLQIFRHPLAWPAEAGVRSMQRIALEANVETAFGLLRVTTTHLEYYSARQRAAQVEQLRELHRDAVAHAGAGRRSDPSDAAFEAVPRAAPALLVGDFNFRPGDPDYQRMLQPIDAATPAYRDAARLIDAQRPHQPTVGIHDKLQWPEPAFTCDFAFVSADLAPRVQDLRVDAATTASDHQPIVIELH